MSRLVAYRVCSVDSHCFQSIAVSTINEDGKASNTPIVEKRLDLDMLRQVYGNRCLAVASEEDMTNEKYQFQVNNIGLSPLSC